jgi:hypothetical protein
LVESKLHKTLVKIIERWIKSYSSEEMIVYADSEDSFLGNIPPKIDTFIPDIFAKEINSKYVIIGEAKSSQRDLESEHSEGQLVAYLKYCKNQSESIVVLAVPFNIVNCAGALLEAIKRQNQLTLVKTLVLTSIPLM